MINAISGDADFIKVLNTSTFTGTVHSTFNRTINMKCHEDGDLYTLACRRVDNGPNSLIIDVDAMKPLEIEVNDRVRVQNNLLIIENKLAVRFDQAAKWESVLPIYPSDVGTLHSNVKKMKEYISLHGVGGGIKKNTIPCSLFEAEISKTLEKRTQSLINEIVNKQFSAALPYAVSIVGLGPGLTPSGDDFLTGLFTTFTMKNNPCYPYRSFCKDVLQEAKALTNDISYITLKKASMGKVRESIISVLGLLLAEDEEDLYLSLNKLVNIGSSSGTDIALGIVLGLEATMRAGGRA